MEQLIIQAISGAVGGNAAGAGAKSMSMGTIGNTIAGLVGGVGGGAALSGLMGGDMSGLISQIGGGGAGGIILTLVAGFIKNKMAS